MSEITPSHLLQQFYASLRTQGEQNLFYVRQGSGFRYITKREAAMLIKDFARVLRASGVSAGDRVAFHAIPRYELWVSEWGALINRSVAVIIPLGFGEADLIETLLETKSKIVIVDTLAVAQRIANACDKLPDLKQIICFEASTVINIPVWTWNDFLESANMHPDYSAADLRAIGIKDTALILYYKDQEKVRQATRYTHELLLEHTAKINTLLGKAGIHKGETVLATTVWEYAVSHIIACYVPVLNEAVVCIAPDKMDITSFENHPHIVIGTSAYFDDIRNHITDQIKRVGHIEWQMFVKAVALGKLKYESPKKMMPLQQLQNAALQATVVKRVPKLLGGNVRLLIGIDNAVHYDTQIFFHTFGIELVEVAPEFFR